MAFYEATVPEGYPSAQIPAEAQTSRPGGICNHAIKTDSIDAIYNLASHYETGITAERKRTQEDSESGRLLQG